jgi:nanoRNase/pAp phosphatase (c-di-AMP/oligoRNAs hydrolase)
MEQKKRLVTRSDFDGLACAMMLRELGMVEDIKFVHPKDVQDGKIELNENDITTNLPYDPRVGIAFDHHESEVDRLKAQETGGKLIIDATKRSAARVVYEYYGGKKVFTKVNEELMAAVDKGDSADFTMEEILHPTGWVLLHYLMDPRTGLVRFRNFRISNYELMMELISYCVDHDIDEILELPDVKERVDLYFEEAEQFEAQLKRIAKVYDKVVVLDLRNEEIIHAGNRFMIYALYP